MAVKLSELQFAELLGPLEALQAFDPSTIARTETLGKAFDFTAAVPVVKHVVELFGLIPAEILGTLPKSLRDALKTHADATWGTIQRMLAFDPNSAGNPAAERSGLISELEAHYANSANSLAPVITLATALYRTGAGLEAEARTTLDSMKETARSVAALQQETAETSARILSEVKNVAAQTGVAQQAGHFGDQAEKHATGASNWQRYTNRMAGGLVAFAVGTWILGYYVVPENAYQAAQLAVSKVLIFSTLAFLLFICARTLMAHRHNEVVNRHRQNALLTFQTLADAADGAETKDVVLTHASACIYAPQDSGFSKGQPTTPSLIEVLPRIGGQASGG